MTLGGRLLLTHGWQLVVWKFWVLYGLEPIRLVITIDERFVVAGPPYRNRTCDPRLRKPILYPAELRAVYTQLTACFYAKAAFQARVRGY